MLQQVNSGGVISADGDIQSGAVIADRIDLRAAKQEFLNHLEVTGISRLHQRRTTKVLPTIYISAFVQQIANDCRSSLAGSEKEWSAAIAWRIDVRAREVKKLQPMQAPNRALLAHARFPRPQRLLCQRVAGHSLPNTT